MEEALLQLSTDGLEFSKRKAMGISGQITVTMDTRALAPDHRIFYRNLHKFRVSQMNEGVDLSDLSDEQWGMVQLDKCHHISTTSTSKDGPQSFRVRICKTCCQEDSHIELGTYVDQESAILVNDTFEILNDRLDRLIVLRVEDKPDLHHLVAKKYDRSKGRDYACILDLISERIAAIEGKKRKPSVSEMIPAFAKRNGELGSVGSAIASVEGNSTSSEASDDLLRHHTAPPRRGSNLPMGSALHNALVSSGNNRQTPARSNRLSSGNHSGRKLSIGSAVDIEADSASNSGSSSTIDDEITVPDETSAALRELSSVCYQRLLSPSIRDTIPGSANLSPGTLMTGTSLFGLSNGSTGGTADLVRSLERARASHPGSTGGIGGDSGVSEITGERLPIGSPFSNTSQSTVLPQAEPASPVSEHHAVAAAINALTNSTNKRSRAAEDSLEAPINETDCDRLASVDGITPSRKRAATFSVSEPYPFRHSNSDALLGGGAGKGGNSIATLTWLASMEECEVDVARSLFELRGNTEVASALFDNRSSASGRSDALSMALGLGSGFATGTYGDYLAYGQRIGVGNEMDYDDNEDEYYDGDGGAGEEEEEEEEEEEDDVEDGRQDGPYHLRRARASMGAGSGGRHRGGMGGDQGNLYGYPTYPHSAEKPYQLSGLTSGFVLPSGVGPQRARSSSMSMLDRSEAAWAILGNTGGYRSKMDPLSMALKKYHERGGSANAAACGFVGIYSPEDRKQRILRFLEKRKRRMWTKKVKYDVRKNFADSRVRVKGRFVKKQDEDAAEGGESRLNSSHVSQSSFEGVGGGVGEDDVVGEVGEADGLYDHTDVDLELLDQLEAQQKQEGKDGMTAQLQDNKGSMKLKLNLKATPTGSNTGTGSGSGRKRSDSVGSIVKSEGRAGSELKLTIPSRRRRNSRVDDELTPRTTVTTETATTTTATTTTVASDGTPSSEVSVAAASPSSSVALRLERANLNSAVKPVPAI
eukprot:CAMPEP_0170425514 /NCGR_PEP_ID=MMETSP0117_2-20130122/38148_1 /TAXON_ID=400756 /ORGANISM="Durinskia baltica, Strain CSIRO CS-38" /LENGTH=987 /DNA_ID=CAMNT_0010684487 /DNA_START=155 /DNA_END=3118 /DNA_ORIENTATION=+